MDATLCDEDMETQMEVKGEQRRKSKQFYAIDDFWNVSLVTGFECPSDPDHWWVP
jgi:hypothetical protein